MELLNVFCGFVSFYEKSGSFLPKILWFFISLVFLERFDTERTDEHYEWSRLVLVLFKIYEKLFNSFLYTQRICEYDSSKKERF